MLENFFSAGQTIPADYVDSSQVIDQTEYDAIRSDPSGFTFLENLFGIGKPKQITNSNSHKFLEVYACTNVLSDDIAKLPVKVYQNVKGKLNRVRSDEHPVAKLLSKSPNVNMTPFVFKKLMMVDILHSGNFIAWIVRDQSHSININELNQGVQAIVPLSQESTTIMLDKTDYSYWYRTEYNGKTYDLKPEDVIHVKDFSRDGVVGRSPIEVIREQAVSNAQATDFNKHLLESEGVPRGILKINTSVSKEARDRVRKEWSEKNSGKNIAVIDNGLDFQQVGLQQSDMQFVEAMKWNQQQIASVYKVPLHKINILDHATFSNIEHQSLDYVKNTIQPFVVQIEEEFTRKLFTESEQKNGYYIKFNLDSELRGDAKTRAEVQEIKLRNGVNTINELRAQDEESPYDDPLANKPFITLNYTTLDRIEDHEYKGAAGSRLNKTKGGDDD